MVPGTLTVGRQRMSAGLAGSEWLFSNLRGNRLSTTNLHRNSFKPLLRKANLPSIRFHDLRHTPATLMLLSNDPIKVVSETLGHANVAITMDMYQHVLPTMQQESADKMDGIFSVA